MNPSVRGWYLSPGLKRIAAERDRQIHAEGFDATHDDAHDGGSIAWAAACYAAPGPVWTQSGPVAPFEDAWPPDWNSEWDKRAIHDRVHQLEIAGALIAAELDRLLRAGAEAEPLDFGQAKRDAL